MKSKPKEIVILAAQEISFARALASNDTNMRERALKKLKKWLTSRSERKQEFTEEGFMRICKGLFYCIYMSDKPLPQEDCVEAVSHLVHCFKTFDESLMFIRCFFQSVSHSWFGLDGHRMDKYLMLVRRFLRQTFECVYKLDWEKEKVERLSKELSTSFSMAPLGLLLHLTDIYMEELAKVGRGELKPETTLELIKPFVEVMSKSTDSRLLLQITNNIFLYLLRQSEEGVKHSIKFQAWKQLGFPGGDIDLMEEVEQDSDQEMEQDIEERQTALDARAGNVDVELPEIAFDVRSIANYLNSIKQNKGITTKFRKQINHIVNKYSKFSSGKYPLGLHKYELVENDDDDEIVEEAAEKLLQFEDESIDSFKRNKKRQKASEWEVSLMETEIEVPSEPPSLNGSWVVSDSLNKEERKVSKKTQKSIKVTEDSSLLKKDQAVVENGLKNEESSSKRAKKKRGNSQNSNDKMDKTNDWGDCSWDFPTENESEIVIQPKRKKQAQTKTPKTPNSMKILTTNVTSLKEMTPGSAKKVEFVLNKNTSQEEREYMKTIKKKPSIPFDANKKPTQGVLKSTPYQSPVNPFYKFYKTKTKS
ncbi:ribosomal RNA processing protein 1 homolog [Cimex lectularius]|uniref:Ribosomal RNA processing protein 1 homolog n=1 Tax=Cimex lectularius TaxID=79782 RepID=A0A8I6RRX0_CIMLE|nr:ribosomal RNA processing protein 1 homolog [Cimex lectularius]